MLHTRKSTLHIHGVTVTFALVQHSWWRVESDQGFDRCGRNILSCDNLSQTFDHANTWSQWHFITASDKILSLWKNVGVLSILWICSVVISHCKLQGHWTAGSRLFQIEGYFETIFF